MVIAGILKRRWSRADATAARHGRAARLSQAGQIVYDRCMNWNIPNTLTLLRLLAAPGVAIMFLYFHRP